MKGIYINIWIEIKGKQYDLTGRVPSLSYDRDIEKENLLNFTVTQSFKEAEDDPIEEGQTVFFEYGYKGGKQSPLHRARITDVGYKYATNLTLTVKARDMGVVLKKSASVQVWNDVTTSEIARTIADRYSMAYRIENTTHKWDSLPQAQKDDWAFLQYVVGMERGGDYICYSDNDVLILEKRGLLTKSKTLFTFRDPNGGVVSVDFKTETSQGSASAGAKATRIGYNMDTGKPIKKSIVGAWQKSQQRAAEERANAKKTPTITGGIGTAKFDDETTGDADMTDGFGYVYSANGEGLKQPKTGGGFGQTSFDSETEEDSPVVDIAETTITPEDDEEEIKSTAATSNKSKTLKRQMVTLEIEGDPEQQLNTIITIAGVLKKHEGNYLIKAIQDKPVIGSGYKTVITAQKNSRKKPYQTGQIKIVNKNVNTSVGENSSSTVEKATKKVFVFDVNGVAK